MDITLEAFLQDICQGVYGPSDLDYDQVYRFGQKARQEDIEVLKEFYWDFTSLIMDADDLDLYELETFIEEVII
jgi:hypothetical protein